MQLPRLVTPARLRFALILGLLLTVAANVGLAGNTRGPKEFAALEDALATSLTRTVLEGLPHPGAEREVFEAERQKPHRVIDGQTFYETPLTPPLAEVAELTAALLAPGAVIDWEGEKKCGGFHADVALATTDGRGTWHVHLCFGCGEVLVTGGRLKREVRFDLSAAGLGKARELVRTWRTRRPPPAHE